MKLSITRFTIAAALALIAVGSAHAQTNSSGPTFMRPASRITPPPFGRQRDRQAHQRPLHDRRFPGVDARQGNRHQPRFDARHR